MDRGMMQVRREQNNIPKVPKQKTINLEYYLQQKYLPKIKMSLYKNTIYQNSWVAAKAVFKEKHTSKYKFR